MHTVYLSLGSNLGDREAQLRAAIAALGPAAVKIIKVSSFYETEPVDYLDQPWFLNSVVQAETDLAPLDLLHTLQSIEARLGGKKLFRNGPRKLDLDILLYADLSIRDPELEIPHPRLLSRRFVLAPLAEIAPTLRHPSWPASVEHLLAQSGDTSEVRRFDTGS